MFLLLLFFSIIFFSFCSLFPFYSFPSSFSIFLLYVFLQNIYILCENFMFLPILFFFSCSVLYFTTNQSFFLLFLLFSRLRLPSIYLRFVPLYTFLETGLFFFYSQVTGLFQASQFLPATKISFLNHNASFLLVFCFCLQSFSNFLSFLLACLLVTVLWVSSHLVYL